MNPDTAYPTQPDVNAGPLPDPFAWPDGRRVTSPAQWPERGRAWAEEITNLQYGGLPPAPERIVVESRCHAVMRRWDDAAELRSYGVRCLGGEEPFVLSAQVLLPRGEGPFPVIVAGDGCWGYWTDALQRSVIDAGLALAIFNRTELAEDLVYGGVPDKRKRSGGLYEVYPGLGFGALSAWAWGYHRMVDLLEQMPEIDASRIAVTGHSRGAKTVLLAAATDERITLTHDNASCAGGSAAYRHVGHGGEDLSIVEKLPSWFGDGIRPYVGREAELPFDQHCLLAGIAPRGLLLTYGLDDRWSNPEGMVQAAAATREVYRFLGAESNFAYHLREGGHFYRGEDLDRLLEFLRWRWLGQAPVSNWNDHPYAHLPEPFTWRAPGS